MNASESVVWRREAHGLWRVDLSASVSVFVGRASRQDRARQWCATVASPIGQICAYGSTREAALRRLRSDYWFPVV